MKTLLVECPRFHNKALREIAIKDSELKDKKGNKIVNCSVCGLSNSRGVCKYMKFKVV
jgi:hypothetical protein